MQTTDPLFPSTVRTFRIPSQRPHPGIFVSHFYILKSLERPITQIQSKVLLRRGLNILWANPNPPEKKSRGGKSKVAGHTAGKSTFCRLIRYVLGESAFGSESQEKKIAAKFPAGWVVLRVELEGKPWVVGRSFSDQNSRFALEGATIESFLADGVSETSGYSRFEGAVELLFVNPLGRRNFPGNHGLIHWQHLLPWFTRDQEARLLSLTTWRGLIGKSQSPATDTDERQFLMRLVLGLLPPGEAAEFDRHEELNETKRSLDAELPQLSAKVEQSFVQLSEWIDVETKNLESPLLLDAIKVAAAEKLATLTKLRSEMPSSEDVQKALEAWNKASGESARTNEAIKSAERHLQELKKQLAECDSSRITMKAQIDDLNRTPPANVCGVLIEHACEAGKLLNNQRPTQDGLGRLLDGFNKSFNAIGQEITAAEVEVTEAKRVASDARLAAQRLQTEHLTLSNQRRAGVDKYLEAKAEEKVRGKLLETTTKVLTTYQTKHGEHKDTAKAIRESGKEQESLRKISTPDREDFSELYQLVLRYMLGEEVLGAVLPDGRALQVTAEGRNDLDSGAMTAAKIISYDIAAMAWGIEGQGHHPRFMIHDSPREADMAGDIYDGLFEAALALEKPFAEGTAPFQYIVTTTATPPETVNQKPWLLEPVLNALIPEKRILGVDL